MARVHGAIMAVLLGVAATASAAEIPVIGLDKDGRETYRVVPRESYLQMLKQVVSDTHDSVLPELACTESRGGWKLHTVGVGIGISATVGLGPIFSVQSSPKILLLYTRSPEPIFPVEQ